MIREAYENAAGLFVKTVEQVGPTAMGAARVRGMDGA